MLAGPERFSGESRIRSCESQFFPSWHHRSSTDASISGMIGIALCPNTIRDYQRSVNAIMSHKFSQACCDNDAVGCPWQKRSTHHHFAIRQVYGNDKTKKFLKILMAGVALVAVLIVANIFLRPIHFAPTVDLDETLPSITLNGCTFHAETMSDEGKPVIIALHGGPGGDYRNLLPIARSMNFSTSL